MDKKEKVDKERGCVREKGKTIKREKEEIN